KPAVDRIMNELVKLRHQMSLNIGFNNYSDYVFTLKNREYSIQDCYTFHESVERYTIPVWKRLAKHFETELGIEKYRPEHNECKKAQREQMHRAFSMLISPLAGDIF
ncbi:hypothetical protein LQV63_31420, partial [Paenibacillus profundus]|nr:hypothetical protein [Paenibacillus profundus]